MAQTLNHTIIGLDVGERRIGVARAHAEARLAEPLLTLDRREYPNIFATLTKLLQEHGATEIVVGLPRGMEGQETAQTATIRAFAHELERVTGLPVHMQDEAATSIMAEEELSLRGKPYQKGDIDKLAATYILRDWLEQPATQEAA